MSSTGQYSSEGTLTGSLGRAGVAVVAVAGAADVGAGVDAAFAEYAGGRASGIWPGEEGDEDSGDLLGGEEAEEGEVDRTKIRKADRDRFVAGLTCTSTVEDEGVEVEGFLMA